MTWSEEMVRVFGYQDAVIAGIAPILARTHAGDRALMRAAVTDITARVQAQHDLHTSHVQLAHASLDGIIQASAG